MRPTGNSQCDPKLRFHTHSAGAGHVVAHCGEASSPFHEQGYILKLDKRRKQENE